MGYKYIKNLSQDRKDNIANMIRIGFMRDLRQAEKYSLEYRYQKFLLTNPTRMNMLVQSTLDVMNSGKIAPYTDYELDRLVLGDAVATYIWKTTKGFEGMYSDLVENLTGNDKVRIGILGNGDEAFNKEYTEGVEAFFDINICMSIEVMNALISLARNLDEIHDCIEINIHSEAHEAFRIENLQTQILEKIISIIDTNGDGQIAMEHAKDGISRMLRNELLRRHPELSDDEKDG